MFCTASVVHSYADDNVPPIMLYPSIKCHIFVAYADDTTPTTVNRDPRTAIVRHPTTADSIAMKGAIIEEYETMATRLSRVKISEHCVHILRAFTI